MTELCIELRKLKYMLLNDIRVEYIFQIGILTQVINIIIGMASYFFMFKLFIEVDPIIHQYKTDPFSYVILGMIINPLLLSSLHGFYSAISISYFDKGLKKVLMTPTSPFILLLSGTIGGIIPSAISAIVYVLVGATVFKVSFGEPQYMGLGVLILVLGVAANLGIGMVLGSLFYLSKALRVGTNPIMNIATIFITTFTGAMFPIELLPYWLRAASYLFPQTYAITAIRYSLINGLFHPAVMQALLNLCMSGGVTIPLGIYLVKKGIQKIRREGFVPPEGPLEFILG